MGLVDVIFSRQGQKACLGPTQAKCWDIVTHAEPTFRQHFNLTGQVDGCRVPDSQISPKLVGPLADVCDTHQAILLVK